MRFMQIFKKKELFCMEKHVGDHGLKKTLLRIEFRRPKAI